MLSIKSLTINYGNRTILKSVNAEFKRGTITVIKGESGSGKSSLLNVLGLMQTTSNCEYTFDNTVVSSFNDKERADFRLHNIGFVFQQSNLIQELTAKENLIVPMSIAGKNTDIEKKAYELIRYVGLEKVWNDYPGSLSGGEEQRLAVARAVANNADIILADEPTASLDAVNSSKVLDLFSKLAHQENKIVIVVSHNESVEKYADVIYEIKEENLIVTKSLAVRVKPDISSVQTKPSQKRSLMRFVRYYTKKRRGDRVLNRVFIAVTAVVVAAAIVSVSFGSGFMAQQEELMNAISGRSIFVVNNTMDHKNLLSQYDYEEALAISPEVIEQIEAISGVNVVYPWYTFLSYGLSPDDTRQANIKIWDGSTLIADKSYVNAPSYSATGDQFTINPLYDEEDFSFVLDYKTDNNIRDGIVLTMALANKLSANPSELIDKQIEIQCFVPTKLFGFDMTVVSNDDEKQVAVEHAYHKLVTIEGTITGILSSSYTLLKTRELNVALLNYDQFIDIITQNKDLNIGEAYPGFPEQALGPSALVVFTNSYENVPIVAAELKSMASAFSVANNSSDVETIKNSLSTTRSILIVVTGVFIGIIAILFGMMYYMKNRSRKKEVGILKAIGFTKLNIATLSMAEMLRLALSAFLFAVILSAILTIVGNKISNQAVFSITSFSILVGFIICVGLVVISGIVPMYNASRVDPIDAIRKTDK